MYNWLCFCILFPANFLCIAFQTDLCASCVTWIDETELCPHILIFFLIASHKDVFAYFCSESYTKGCLVSHWVFSTMNSTCQNSRSHLISVLYNSFPDSMIELTVLNVFHDWAPNHQLFPYMLLLARLLSAASSKRHWFVLVRCWNDSFSSYLISVLSLCLQLHFWHLCLSRGPFLPSTLTFLSSRIILLSRGEN